MEWFDLLSVQGTLKSLLQHSTSKASVVYVGSWIDKQMIGCIWKDGQINGYVDGWMCD